MRKQLLTKVIGFLLVLCMFPLNVFSVFAYATDSNDQTGEVVDSVITNNLDEDNNFVSGSEYQEGVVLVKYTGEDANVFAGLDIISAEPLYSGSSWYTLVLNESTKTAEMVQYFTELEIFDCVDFDYIMKSDAVVEHVGIGNNPTYNHNQKKYFETHKIQQGWEYLQDNNINPGGSSDVIVAVIDTGVDYNHEDLKNNIWINYGEIPNNGKDDDGNGYIDDVYGWDCVGNDKDPMDDNGHGTHVAGIIAAENNKVGGVGVAFNCKIMVIKAGNSSGYFNNSDIAEAVQYAYMNGASVINMSFGGSSITMAVEDALQEAYNSCILVAAAGNDGACNNLACGYCEIKRVSYPAALPYVIGVMSVDHGGKNVSSFSNYDHNPYNNIEYEVYAVGESVYSCWPNNKYATLNGTSMAAPMVAGMAALLRSYYSDREVYSTKFIQSQIINTGAVLDGAHSVVNVHEALTKLPTPEVNIYNYRIDDSTLISANNNGNGVINAGETVRLYVSLHNRGGVATDVNVTIDTIRNGDSSLTDPYFTLVNTSVVLSDIGTYSVREAADGQYFEIIVAENCPNDYIANFNIHFTYKNGMDEKDKTVYEDDGRQKAQFNVSRGYYLPSIISENTTFKNDRLYIVGDEVVIPEGVTVTFEEGCQIQFYDDRTYVKSPRFIVAGTLNINGTNNNPIYIFPNERHLSDTCIIEMLNANGKVKINSANAINLFGEMSYNNSIYSPSNIIIDSSQLYYTDRDNTTRCHFGEISNSYVETAVQIQFSLSKFEYNYFVQKNNSYQVGHITVGSNSVEISSNIFISSNNEERLIESTGAIECYNNIFTTKDNDVKSIGGISIAKKDRLYNNVFSSMYQQYASQVITGYYDSTGNPTVDIYGSLLDASLLWPHIVSLEMFDKNGNPITTVGKEEIKVRVTFNRPMDKTKDTFLTFGTVEPYGDYRIDGEYISDTVWEGTYTLKARIENGQNFFKVNNAYAAGDQTKMVFGEYQLHEFTIDTTAAMSMDLIANPTAQGIELTWAQDDYDTIMGYNIYRATSENGSYVKINPYVLLDTDYSFIDASVENGKTYWYAFTAVLSDFTESSYAGKTSATAIDSTPPTITHTPPTLGYLNQNLIISCNVTDNIGVESVTLYYRTVGLTEWRKLTMSKASNQYRATIYGSSLSLEGLEYYIVASDGVGESYVASASNPNHVDIIHASSDHDFASGLFANEEGHWRICTVCAEKGSVSAHIPGAPATETTPQTCTECAYVIKAALGHTHKYGTQYKSDNQQHWYECSCGEKANVENHIYDHACDIDCNKCGAVRAIQHNFDSEHKSNEYQHWYECSCGAKNNVENHIYDNQCDAYCNKCGATRSIEHSYSTNYVINSYQHWNECSCGEKTNISAHVPGAPATETTAQRCTECGYVIQAALGHSHTYSTEYVVNENQHWYECSCGAKNSIESHMYDNNCDTDCNKCGVTRAIQHNYSAQYKSNDYQHWNECSCGAKNNVENHVYSNTCDNDCNKCGYVRTVDHKYGDHYVINDYQHWNECSCGEKINVNAHIPGAPATETTAQICTECGYVIKAALGHTHSYDTMYKVNELQHWYECSCGAKSNIEKHAYSNVCDADCNKCGATRSIEHSYGDDYIINEYQHWNECSCGKKGNVENHKFDNACDYDCNECGIVRTTEHSFDNGVVTKEPSTTEFGEKTYTCTECGEKKHETIDKIADTEEDTNTPDDGENDDIGEKDHSKCLEEATGWERFWNSIGNFFRRIFSKNVKCVPVSEFTSKKALITTPRTQTFSALI